MLLITIIPSRETGCIPSVGAAMRPARSAYSSSAPPSTMPMNSKINTPRSGSDTKLCTEVITPERTRNVPSKLSPNVTIASSNTQPCSCPRFFKTVFACKSAVPESHGSSEAFSTGSQNQKPPQPSTR